MLANQRPGKYNYSGRLTTIMYIIMNSQFTTQSRWVFGKHVVTSISLVRSRYIMFNIGANWRKNSATLCFWKTEKSWQLCSLFVSGIEADLVVSFIHCVSLSTETFLLHIPDGTEYHNFCVLFDKLYECCFANLHVL